MSASGNHVKSDESIAVHVNRDVVSFSGNSLFLDTDAPICPTKPNGDKQDSSYIRFDTDSCFGSKTHDDERTYGSYNWVLAKLELSHTSSRAAQYLHLQGAFDCSEMSPVR
jgi:hypothetical protein